MLNTNKSLPNYASDSNPTLFVPSFDTLDNTREKQTYHLNRNGYSIHIVNSLKHRIKANTLIKRMYASRGYQTQNASIFPPSPDQITFATFIGEIIIGTVTLKNDSANGLLADELYGDEINLFRKNGRKVCELSKFALDPQYSSKEMITSLFQVTFLYARNVLNTTDFFCEVNPRHAGFHKHVFGFQPSGELRTCPRVNAPAVLLHLELDHYATKHASALANINVS
ncbi:MAG TPA: N-acetyltransferase [Nitrosomonas sp.]|nr:N-acetyltransferase [Nitrosomonas sp.]